MRRSSSEASTPRFAFASLLVLASCSAGGANDAPSPFDLGGGGDPGATGGGGPTGPYTCPVQIFQQCKACHDGRGTAATPMGLLTYEDFRAPSHSNPAAAVYQVLPTRLRSVKPTPMPPEGTLDGASLAAIDSWVAAGAPDCGFAHRNPPPGAGGTPSYGGAPPASGGASSGGAAPGGGGAGPGFDVTPYLSPDGTYFIKEPPGNLPVGPDAPGADYCFNLVAHGAQTPPSQDATPYQVKVSEYYHQFFYTVPYTQPVWTLSTRPIIDNNKVLHHWLLFNNGGSNPDGSHADEVGLQVGNSMLTGWAPGGNPLDMPPGVGLEMPPPGGRLSMETHYNNSTGAAATDRSGVRLCVTSKQPANVASLTWLGTEIINVPAQQRGSATGTCTTWKGKTDVHVIQTVPHMHKLGAQMKTVINHAAGGQDLIVDKPFAFTDQRAYPADNVIHAGDTISTTCTYQNTTTAPVGFGTGTTQEMCYNFVIYYPAHALDGVGGIEGSSNMCLF